MIDVRNLHPLEVKLLLAMEDGQNFDEETVCRKCSFSTGHCNQSLSWVLQKGFISQVSQEVLVFYELTEKGKKYLQQGFVEQRMFEALESGAKTLAQLQSELGEEQKDIGSAFAFLRKNSAVVFDESKNVCLAENALLPPVINLYSSLLKKAENSPLSDKELTDDEKKAVAAISKKRGDDQPLKVIERTRTVYTLTEQGSAAREELKKQKITGDEIGELTKEMLAAASWKGKTFREYDVVHTPVSKLLTGRFNPYSEFIRSIKDKLVAFGFEEFDGPLVENEFWNGDALFMPQFHPARDIHDVYYLENPKHSGPIEQPYLDNVALTHQNGWKTGSRGWEYPFDRNFSMRTLLRSQGTVLSAHQLTKAKVPGKYFGVVRCFRYDQVDATHGADFYQTEGIVLGDNVNFRTLLGLLKMFATEIAGAKEVKYVPGYFPFTEPSVEVHIKHPVLGWFELGGSGIFRPEVTKPLGINCPVLAWGLGIDRMALMNLGLSDIRELFSQNLENVRLRRG